MTNQKLPLRALTEGAVLVAVAQILSYIKLWEMPWGGSVVLAMVPMILFAVRWGVGPGLLGSERGLDRVLCLRLPAVPV